MNDATISCILLWKTIGEMNSNPDKKIEIQPYKENLRNERD
ncbi:hypothetical protein [Leptospira noguchii]|nr:hypothetical protein [Leptospira noguchii]